MTNRKKLNFSRLRQPPHAVVLALMLIVFVQLTWSSIARYHAFNASTFDLGVMSQAIWSAANGQPLVFTSQGIPISRLARHVELFYFALAPLYALLPSPVTLLVVQAGLFSIGALPLYDLARRRLKHTGAALAITVIYLIYPAAQTPVLFDFHGDTLAAPFVLFALNAADRRRWRQYSLWIALVLTCKVYAAVIVAILGGALWLKGERRAGAWTVGAGAVWGFIGFFVLRELFAPAEANLVHATASSYFSHYFGQTDRVLTSLFARAVNVIVVVGPALLVGWRAPIWLLAATAVIGPVALSSGPGPTYDFRFHHYALAIPFLMAALIYGAATRRQNAESSPSRLPWHFPLAVTLLLTVTFSAFFVNGPFNPDFYRFDLSSYGITSRDRFVAQWLARNVPSAAPVAAAEALGTHLANRPTLYLTNFVRQVRPLVALLPEVDYVVTDTLFELEAQRSDGLPFGGFAYDLNTVKLLLAHPGFGLTESRDGLLLFGRQGPFLTQTVTSEPLYTTLDLPVTFSDAIELRQVEVTPLDERRYRLQFDWIALRSLANMPALVAVSRPAGLDHSRFVHLPTLAIHPTTTWQPGEIIRETIEIKLPDDAPQGSYALFTGWYDSSSRYAYGTDARSRIGIEVKVGKLTVP